jgi:hypothetical protein
LITGPEKHCAFYSHSKSVDDCVAMDGRLPGKSKWP